MTRIYKLLYVLIFALIICGCSETAQKQYPKPVIVKPDEDTHYTINGYKQKTSSVGSASVSDDKTKGEVEYIGNRSSKKYHLPSCTYAVNMREENRREFDKFTNPEDYDYVKCKQCFKDK